MSPISFEDAVQQAMERDKQQRYQPEAYAFVRDALHVAATKFRGKDADQHVTGRELLEGVRLHALTEFGPMARFILAEWGIERGEDVGSIVYNLIELEYFGRNEGDSIEDFAGGYDFDDAFTKPFLPMKTGQPQQNPTRAGQGLPS